MSDQNFDFLVFIGRFQPYHKGHEAVVREALQRASHLIILVGSAHRPRCTRNPWTFSERETMIRATLSDSENRRVFILPVMDASYNDELWVATVQKCVGGIVAAHYTTPHREPTVGLIGRCKDHTSYYLKMFPQWQSVDVTKSPIINATDVREAVFRSDLGRWEDFRTSVDVTAGSMLPEAVLAELRDFVRTPLFEQLRDEYEFVRSYRAQWNDAPYEPMFITVDAVVIQSGHILLVERKARPGKGQWALPGGFLDSNETLQQAVVRELKEETRIKVPAPVLAGSIAGEGVFDEPNRSARGRTVTHAFLIQLAPDTSLPKVKGGDDAKNAFWVPLASLDPSIMFEDHYFIIQRMVGQMV